MRTFIAESALTLFVIIDPIGVTPIFIGLCGDRSEAARNRIARHSVVIAGVVLLAFIAVGSPLLQYLGRDGWRPQGGRWHPALQGGV